MGPEPSQAADGAGTVQGLPLVGIVEALGFRQHDCPVPLPAGPPA